MVRLGAAYSAQYRCELGCTILPIYVELAITHAFSGLLLPPCHQHLRSILAFPKAQSIGLVQAFYLLSSQSVRELHTMDPKHAMMAYPKQCRRLDFE